MILYVTPLDEYHDNTETMFLDIEDEPDYGAEPKFVPSKKHAVRGYRCCDSGSCHNRKYNNQKAKKSKTRK